MNVAMPVRLWPGTVGCSKRRSHYIALLGDALAHAVLFGVGLQAIEITAAAVLGAAALAYEAIWFATLIVFAIRASVGTGYHTGLPSSPLPCCQAGRTRLSITTEADISENPC